LNGWMKNIVSPMYQNGSNYLGGFGQNLSLGNNAGMMLTFNPVDYHFSSRLGSRETGFSRHVANKIKGPVLLSGSPDGNSSEKSSQFEMMMDGGDSSQGSASQKSGKEMWNAIDDELKPAVAAAGAYALYKAFDDGTELSTGWIAITDDVSVKVSGQKNNSIGIGIKVTFMPDCSSGDCGKPLPYPEGINDPKDAALEKQLSFSRMSGWACLNAYCTEEDYDTYAGWIPASGAGWGVIDPAQDQNDGTGVQFKTVGDLGPDDAPGGIEVADDGMAHDKSAEEAQRFNAYLEWQMQKALELVNSTSPELSSMFLSEMGESECVDEVILKATAEECRIAQQLGVTYAPCN